MQTEVGNGNEYFVRHECVRDRVLSNDEQSKMRQPVQTIRTGESGTIPVQKARQRAMRSVVAVALDST